MPDGTDMRPAEAQPPGAWNRRRLTADEPSPASVFLDVPNMPLMHIDARVGGAEGPCSGPPDETFVKLAESATHWHAYNESGLYSIPYEELKYVRYYEEDCPTLR